MSFDGTDWLVLLTLVGVLLTFVGISIAWRHYRLAQRASESDATLIMPMPSESGKNFDTIPDPRDYPRDDSTPSALTNIASPFPPLKPAARMAEESASAPDHQTSESPKPKRRKTKPQPPAPASAQWQDLVDETVTVPAGYGQHWVTRLDLDEGDEIRGTLTEVDDDDFSYMVLDESNYAGFRGGDDYEVVDEAEETSSVRVDFLVDEADRYYLVLYAYGKQNDREVEVSLRVRRGHS